MKVLVISDLYPSKVYPTKGLFVQQQVAALTSLGIEIRVICPTPWAPFPLTLLSEKWAQYGEVPRHEVVQGINVIYPRVLSFPRSWRLASLGKRVLASIRPLVRALAEHFRFDVIHAHVALANGYAAVQLADLFGVPAVVTIHGQDLQDTVNRNHACAEVVGRVLEGASGVVFVSEKLRQMACSRFGPNDKWCVIPNGTNPLGGVIRTNDHAGGSPKVLSVSNLIPIKGIDINLFALQAVLRRYPEVTYTVIGDGPDRKRLENLARDLGVAHRVEFLGRLDHAQVLQHMAACTLFSLPSWREAFGVVYLEAMARGKPVVGCRGEGISEFVIHGVNGMLVEPKSVEDVVKTWEFLLSHPEDRAAIGQRAWTTVSTHFTWEHNARRTYEFYCSVTKGE